MDNESQSIGIIIPSRNEADKIGKCLQGLKSQSIKFRLLVIDSSSTDNTLEIARAQGAEVHTIPRMEFNHGATRELGRRMIATDIVVYITADAFMTDEHTIERLIEPILMDKAVVAYGRQVPRKGADMFESVPRLFNYPADSNIRSIEDIPKYGVYTFFCSNSCAAYRNIVLDEIGGFESVLTNEDYFAVAKILQRGYRIAYVSEAIVEHSHYYTIFQDFKRYFDTGYVRAERPWVNQLVGQAENRGVLLFRMTLKAVRQENILLLPKAFFVFFIRWLGFRLGYISLGAPVKLKKWLSAQPYYWDTKYYRNKSERI